MRAREAFAPMPHEQFATRTLTPRSAAAVTYSMHCSIEEVVLLWRTDMICAFGATPETPCPSHAAAMLPATWVP